MDEFKTSAQSAGLEAQQTALGRRFVDFSRFVLSAPYPDYLALWQGLSNDTFFENMMAMLRDKRIEKAVVAYGSKSAIAAPEFIEPTLKSLGEFEAGQKLSGEEPNVITSIRVEGANHKRGDRLKLLAKLYKLAF